MIQKDFPEYFVDNTSFIAVLHNRNSVKSIFDFIYNRYHKIPKISQLNTGNVNPAKKDVFDRIFHNQRESEDAYQNETSNLLSGTHEQFISYKRVNSFLRNYSINFYISHLHYLLYDRVNPVPTGTCKSFDGKIFLNTQHNLYPCEKISYKYDLGKVNDQVIIDIPAIVKKYSFYYERFKKVCQNCYSFRFCSICIWTIGSPDKLDMEELVCPGFQDQEAFKNRLNYIFSLLEKKE